MTRLLAVFCAAACLTGSAFIAVAPANAQDTTVVRTEGPGGTRTVVKRRTGYGTVRKVVRRSADGCRSRTVKRTNAMGDTVVRTRSSC
jgi:hypothetical protein